MLFPHFLCQVKEVLSANAEYPVKAEQLHDETDLNTKITRCLRTDNSACTCVYMWLLCCLLSPDTATHPLLFLVKLLYSEDRTTNFPPLILSLYRSLTLIRIIRNTSHSLFFISSSYYLITIPFFPPLSLSLSLSSLPLLPAFSVLSSSYFNVAHFLFLRVEFEAACEDLFARLTAPIDAALKMAGKSITDVQSVELLGEFKTALFTIILYLCREFSNVVIAIVFKLALF